MTLSDIRQELIEALQATNAATQNVQNHPRSPESRAYLIVCTQAEQEALDYYLAARTAARHDRPTP